MIIISMMMIVLFLTGIFLFSSTKILCILGILAAVAVILLRLKGSPLQHLPKKTLQLISTVSFIAVFVIGAFTSMSTPEGGLNDYQTRIDQVMGLLLENDLVEARGEVNAIKEEYGPSDNTVMLETLLYIGEGDYGAAITSARYYSNERSVEYITLMETVYLSAGSRDYASNLNKLYTDAAAYHPDWTHIQKMAGISYIDRSEFTKGEYHLLRAYEQDPSDYETAYYLGVTCYEQKRPEEALMYFQEAAERQPDEKTAGYIAWYAQTLEQ